MVNWLLASPRSNQTSTSTSFLFKFLRSITMPLCAHVETPGLFVCLIHGCVPYNDIHREPDKKGSESIKVGNRHPETAATTRDRERIICLRVDNDPQIGMHPLTRSWIFILLRKGAREDVGRPLKDWLEWQHSQHLRDVYMKDEEEVYKLKYLHPVEPVDLAITNRGHSDV